MKKNTALLWMSSLLLLTGCGKYSSTYTATLFVHNNFVKKATMHFSTFKGRMVFKLKCDNEKISYTATLGAGDAIIYYDYQDEKKVLFQLHEGEEINSSSEAITSSKVYVIVEFEQVGHDGKIDFNVSL